MTKRRHRGTCMRDEGGMLTLEACISVTLFAILVLFMMTLFPMYAVQHAVAHALLQTAESMSLDAYAADRLDEDEIADLPKYVSNLATKSVTEWMGGIEPYSSTDDSWYAAKSATERQQKTQEVARRRFVAYFTGSDQMLAANEPLLRLYVKDGIDGMDFSETSLVGARKGYRYVSVTVTYYLRNEFFGLLALDSKFEVRQSAGARLWE